MQNVVESEVWATGSIGADGTVVVARGLSYSAAAHTTDTTGIYNLVLDRALAQAESIIEVTPRTTPGLYATVVHTSNTVKQVNMNTIAATGGVAADCAFDILVKRITGGTGR